MNNEALQCLNLPAVLLHARINAIDGDYFGLVSSDGGRYWLRPAVGCLLQPAVGDRVLISLEGDEGYILCVLERSQSQPAHLHLEGDLSLTLPTGALNIQTRDGLTLDAGELLVVEAQQGIAQLAHLQLSLDTLQVSGERIDSHWSERNDSLLRHSEVVVWHAAEYGDSRRHIHGHEEIQAGSLRQRVNQEWSLQGESLNLYAEVTVTIGGKHIKLG